MGSPEFGLVARFFMIALLLEAAGFTAEDIGAAFDG
jgi:hypothetical protein